MRGPAVAGSVFSRRTRGTETKHESRQCAHPSECATYTGHRGPVRVPKGQGLVSKTGRFEPPVGTAGHPLAPLASRPTNSLPRGE